jgi:hypothetical protein
MKSTNKNILISVLAVLVFVGICFLAFSISKRAGDVEGSISSKEIDSIHELVTEFGQKLKMVSLLAPNAGETIEIVYGPYVAHELITEWKADPSKAPGRETSSPYPDSITITRMQRNTNDTYSVFANIEEVTNSGPAGTLPVVLIIKHFPEGWRITGYIEEGYNSEA